MLKAHDSKIDIHGKRDLILNAHPIGSCKKMQSRHLQPSSSLQQKTSSPFWLWLKRDLQDPRGMRPFKPAVLSSLQAGRFPRFPAFCRSREAAKHCLTVKTRRGLAVVQAMFENSAPCVQLHRVCILAPGALFLNRYIMHGNGSRYHGVND